MEFTEKDNLNWSCRIHPNQNENSSWGGNMYWCCGKTRKNAPGCKKNKHISYKSDNEEESDKDEEKIVKCTACKSPNHEAA